MMGVIYKVTCLTTGKLYIGQTINFSKRQKQHLESEDNTHFHRAIRKYGPENFNWEIIEECDRSLLNEREIYWINYYNSFKEGYNSTNGGEDASPLIEWRKNHPEQAIAQKKVAIKKAQDKRRENYDEWVQQLKSISPLGAEASKKKVRCVELNLIFSSLSDAARWSESENNPNGQKSTASHISRVCRGGRKTTGGYHWEYVNN